MSILSKLSGFLFGGKKEEQVEKQQGFFETAPSEEKCFNCQKAGSEDNPIRHKGGQVVCKRCFRAAMRSGQRYVRSGSL